MQPKDLIRTIATFSEGASLGSFRAFTDTLPKQGQKMPVLFTSHGKPMDIPASREHTPFWQRLFDLGTQLRKTYDVKAAVVISAHWLTEGTFVNIAQEQQQLYDYYGFPESYYQVQYHAKGAAEIARELTRLVPSVAATTDWGLDHGAWPMLMHLFPEADIPVFQLSIDYHAAPDYHYQLGIQLKGLRDKGVLIIGSGSLIHNLPLVGQKLRLGDLTPYGWEAEYDGWIKKQLDQRSVSNIINYEYSHKLGKLAAPTPDHFVPVLYSLGLMDSKDELQHFYEEDTGLPAFSDRSFLLSNI